MTRRPLSARTALLSGVALAFAIAAGPASAQEDINLTGQILTGLGLVAAPPPDIDYRERAPLVVPPTGDILPPPRDASSITQNPAWPKDHDEVARRKAREAAPVQLDETDTAHRTISRAELERGNRKITNTGSGFENWRTNDDNRLSLGELGFTGWSSKKEKVMVFEGEPEREDLIQPPPGYQTPAPGAAYGVVSDRAEDKEWRMPSWFDRTQANK